MARPKKNKGPLFEPIILNSNFDLENDQNHLEKLIEQYFRKAIDKIPLLMTHYEIDNSEDYFRLALALMMEHEPGFQFELIQFKMAQGDYGAVVPIKTIKDGRPRKWTNERLLKLANDVEIKIKSGLKAREAIERLVYESKSEWYRPKDHKGTLEQWIETLESRYQDGKTIRAKIKSVNDKAEELLARVAKFNSKKVPKS